MANTPTAQALFLRLLLVGTLSVAVGACQSCLIDMTMSSLFHNEIRNKKRGANRQERTIHSSALPQDFLKPHVFLSASSSALTNGIRSPSILKRFDSPAIRFLALQKLVSVVYSNRIGVYSSTGTITISKSKNTGSTRIRNRWAGGLFSDELSENDDAIGEGRDEGKNMVDDSADSLSGDLDEVMSDSMIMAIAFYKNWISPLLPPACRFLPTCSQYGAQAIKEFGSTKGLLLTAWRLARCSPFGGRGYDPPVWPPVAYNYGSY